MAKKKWELKSTVEGNFIKVALSAEEWISFDRAQWDGLSRALFADAGAVETMRLEVEWAHDWHIKDKQGALVPFEKQKLLDCLDDGTWKTEYPRFTQETSNKIIIAVLTAMNESLNVPLVTA